MRWRNVASRDLRAQDMLDGTSRMNLEVSKTEKGIMSSEPCEIARRRKVTQRNSLPDVQKVIFVLHSSHVKLRKE